MKRVIKWIGIQMIFFLFAVMCGCGRTKSQVIYQDEDWDMKSESSSSVSDEQEETGEVSEGAVLAAPLAVYVCGAVSMPGVYEVQAGSRVVDAVNAAGGMLSEAEPDNLNLARLIADGEQIRVPYKGETKEPEGGGQSGEAAQEENGKINLNTANAEQLMTLPGIGKAKADSILSYREEHGKFQAIEDIMKIDGIKEGVFNKMKEFIYVK